MQEPATEFQTIRRSTAVANRAIETIKEMIVRGELKAGQRLPAERDLAARLGVSRPSLREAIRALASLLSSVSTLSYVSRGRTAQSARIRSRALADHEAMVRVLKARDPQAVHIAMVEHLQHVLEGLTAAQPSE